MQAKTLTTVETIQKRLRELVAEGDNILATFEDELGLEVLFPPAFKGNELSAFLQWKQNSLQLLRRLYPEDDTINVLGTGKEHDKSMVRRILSMLISASDEVDHGLIGDMQKTIADDLFESILDLAHQFFTQGIIPTAAIYCRVALEQGLQVCADRHGVRYTKRTLNQLLDALKKQGVLTDNAWRQAQAWLDISNFYAHAQPRKAKAPSRDDVRSMIENMADFLKALP